MDKRGYKRGQMWIMDAALSLILFAAAAIISFNIILNSMASNTDFDHIKEDASKISEYLLSEGVPENWNASTMIRPGFVTGGRLNATKIILGMNFTNASYAVMKSRLQTNYDFLVVFENYSGDVVDFGDYCVFGDPNVKIEGNLTSPVNCTSVNFTTTTYTNLVVINRFAVLSSDIVRMVVYVWD
ncbi:hypothetical protein JW711_02590 [Candidatus Woesearchaeota archaeon]|nr:hypothetical protein [Candidatus Woesearchaeota archaeon]